MDAERVSGRLRGYVALEVLKILRLSRCIGPYMVSPF